MRVSWPDNALADHTHQNPNTPRLQIAIMSYYRILLFGCEKQARKDTRSAALARLLLRG